MKSMTGYGYSEYHDEKYNIILEIKSYNNRYLDIIVKHSPYLSPLEPRVRESIASKVKRGRVEIYIRVEELEEDISIDVDKNIVQNYLKVLNKLSEAAGINEKIHLSHLLRMEGIIKQQKNCDLETIWNKLESILDKTFVSFDSSRIKEGEITKKDIFANLETVEKAIEFIESKADVLESLIKNNLKERFEALLGDHIDENKILAETAVLLMKYGINEEIVRFKGHLNSFKELASDQSKVAGKRLDFICQELNREINTIGSKSVVLEVNKAVVDVKDALEKIREQIRNIE